MFSRCFWAALYADTRLILPTVNLVGGEELGYEKRWFEGLIVTINPSRRIYIWSNGGLARVAFEQDGSPRDDQRDEKNKCLTGRKTLAIFCWILWGPIRINFFHQDPGWWLKGQPKRQNKKMYDRQKNLSEFLLNFKRSYQDLTFSIRIQDGGPRNNQRHKKRKCLTGRKTLAGFCWILWSPTRTSLFPPGSRMEAQETTKGTKQGNVWQIEKP